LHIGSWMNVWLYHLHPQKFQPSTPYIFKKLQECRSKDVKENQWKLTLSILFTLWIVELSNPDILIVPHFQDTFLILVSIGLLDYYYSLIVCIAQLRLKLPDRVFFFTQLLPLLPLKDCYYFPQLLLVCYSLYKCCW